MKISFLGFILIFILNFNLYAQDPPVNIQGSPVPSNSELRNMGVPESKIKELNNYLQNNKGTQTGTNGAIGETPNNPNLKNSPLNPFETNPNANKESDISSGNSKKEGEKDGKNKEIQISDSTDKTKFSENAVWGKSIFRQNNLNFFNKSSEAIAPDNYRLGSGDEISVNVWGFTDYSDTYKIGEMGFVDTKYIGRLYLKGLTFVSAKELIKRKLSGVMDLQNSSIDINLTYTKTITVNIVGEVIVPGSYTIPAINTAFNALIVAGGPTKIGSIRNIYIRREGKIVDSLDVYKFLLDSKYYSDLFLQNNDYIFVPTMKKFVTVTGEVKRPDIFELKSNENMNALLKFAGGLNATSFTTNIQIKRIQNNKEVLLDINLDSLLKNNIDLVLFDEDEVIIKHVPQGIGNMASIYGSVNLPGDYEIKTGEKLSSLIKKAGGLGFDAYLDKAYVSRIKPDLKREYIPVDLLSLTTDTASIANLPLLPFDIVTILSKNAFTDPFNVEVMGAVRIPNKLKIGSGLRIKDALALCGGISSEAFLSNAYLIRIKDDLSNEYITLNIKSILEDEKSKYNFTLKPGDIIKILSKADFNDKFNISVYGAVRNQGFHPYGAGLTLKDVLLMSGGLKPEADVNKIEIARAVTFNDTLDRFYPSKKIVSSISLKTDINSNKEAESFLMQPFDEVYVRENPEFYTQSRVYIKGEVLYPGVYALVNKNEKIADVIERAGGLTIFAAKVGARVLRQNVGSIPIQIENATKNKNSPYNFSLVDSDTIFIPKTIELVRVSGVLGTYNTNMINTPYFGKRAGFYIKNFAGGFPDTASKKNVYVIHQSGLFKKTRSFLFFKVYPKVSPNSAIFVPPSKKKIKKRKEESKPVDWNEMIEKTSVKITGIISLILLMRAFSK